MHKHNHNHKNNNVTIALFLNVSFTVIEIIGGLYTNSLTILADAMHDFGDSVALFAAWISEKISHKQPDKKRTFGYRRLSLLSAFFSAIVLCVGSVIVLSQAIPRLLNPEPVHAQGMFVLAIVGILFNGLGAWRLKQGQGMNEKVLTWHLLEDVLGWVVVLVGSIVISLTNIQLIDPIMTIGFSGYILYGVYKNLKEISNIFLQGVPEHISIDHIKEGLLTIKGVKDIHDVHVWSLEGETDIFSGHVVVTEKLLQDSANTKKLVRDELANHHIAHATIELESELECEGDNCEVAHSH